MREGWRNSRRPNGIAIIGPLNAEVQAANAFRPEVICRAYRPLSDRFIGSRAKVE